MSRNYLWNERMDLKCFVYPGWEPRIRPASTKRQWMDGAPEAYPYRCLPLSIANSHGWEILNARGFEAVWNGGMAPEDVTIRTDPGTPEAEMPQALFGQGTFTIHVPGLLRTPPGWNLYVSGSPNTFKDGAAPLAGVIETDWSPYSFTMNWRLTRPDYPVRFEENEPIAHFFPVQRAAIEQFDPSFIPIDEDPELKEMFEQWSRSREAFQQQVREHPPTKPADKWQKLYYRGLMPDGACPVADHRSKLRLREFARPELTGDAPEAMARPVTTRPPHGSSGRDDRARRKYEWLLETQEQQRALSPIASNIAQCRDLTGDQFLDLFYAPSRPAMLTGEIAHWPACRLWTPQYLRDRIGGRMVEYQGGRSANEQFERHKDTHKQHIPFDRFIDLIEERPGNDAYVTAYNSASNADLVKLLREDMGVLDKYLAPASDGADGMLWIGPAGTFTPLHHDLTNNLIAQVTGRKKVIMASANQTPKLYNDRHVFSEIADVEADGIDFARHALLKDVQFYELILEPGDCLFVPVGWWHQVRALDFSVSITYTNFRWRNDFYRTYPAEA